MIHSEKAWPQPDPQDVTWNKERKKGCDTCIITHLELEEELCDTHVLLIWGKNCVMHDHVLLTYRKNCVIHVLLIWRKNCVIMYVLLTWIKKCVIHVLAITHLEEEARRE